MSNKPWYKQRGGRTTKPTDNNTNNKAKGAPDELLERYEAQKAARTKILRSNPYSPPLFINPNFSHAKALSLSKKIDDYLEKCTPGNEWYSTIKPWLDMLHPNPVTYSMAIEKWLKDIQSQSDDLVGEELEGITSSTPSCPLFPPLTDPFPDGFLIELLHGLSPEISHHLIVTLGDLYITQPPKAKNIGMFFHLNQKNQSSSQLPFTRMPVKINNPHHDTQRCQFIKSIQSLVDYGPMDGVSIERVIEGYQLKKYIFSQLQEAMFFSRQQLIDTKIARFLPQNYICDSITEQSNGEFPLENDFPVRSRVVEVKDNDDWDNKEYNIFQHLFSLIIRGNFSSLHKWIITDNNSNDIHDNHLIKHHNILKQLRDQLKELIIGRFEDQKDLDIIFMGKNIHQLYKDGKNIHQNTQNNRRSRCNKDDLNKDNKRGNDDGDDDDAKNPQTPQPLIMSKLTTLSTHSLPSFLLNNDLFQCPNLVELNLEPDDGEFKMTSSVIKWINGLEKLERLSLRGVSFNSKTLSLLSQSSILLQLTHLDLSSISIQEEKRLVPDEKSSATAFKGVFCGVMGQGMEKLIELNLHQNSGHLINALLPIISSTPTLRNLKVLKLHDCPMVTTNAISTLYSSKYMKNLTALSYGVKTINFEPLLGDEPNLNPDNLPEPDFLNSSQQYHPHHEDSKNDHCNEKKDSCTSPFPHLTSLSVGSLYGPHVPLERLIPRSLLVNLESLSIAEEYETAQAIDFLRDLFRDNYPFTSTSVNTTNPPPSPMYNNIGYDSSQFDEDDKVYNLLAPKLTHLEIALGNHSLTDTHIELLSSSHLATKLQFLGISSGQGISDEGIMEICDRAGSKLLNLVHLNLSDNFNLSLHTLSHLNASPFIKQLKSIGLHTTDINASQIQRLLRGGFEGMVYCNHNHNINLLFDDPHHNHHNNNILQHGDNDNDDQDDVFAFFGAGDSSDGDYHFVSFPQPRPRPQQQQQQQQHAARRDNNNRMNNNRTNNNNHHDGVNEGNNRRNNNDRRTRGAGPPNRGRGDRNSTAPRPQRRDGYPELF